MSRNFRFLYVRNVTSKRVFVVEIRGVGFLREAVPLASEYTGSTGSLETDAQTSDAGKQVDEAKTTRRLSH